MELIKTERQNLCFIGDIHGDFTGIAGMMKFSKMEDVGYIFCGDCGFGFESIEYYNQTFNKVGKTANKVNATCFFVRGNHESKEYYDFKLINKKRFKTVKDYTVIQTPNHNILCVGGATSIDRVYRMEANAAYVRDYMRYHPVSEEEAIRKQAEADAQAAVENATVVPIEEEEEPKEPIVKEQEYRLAFEVFGNKEELTSLCNFIRENGYRYNRLP